MPTSTRLRSDEGAAWRALLTILVALLLAGSALASAAAAAPRDLPAPARADRELTVMTRNLYLGAELGPIFAATSQAELVGAATATFAAALASDFPGRAELIADEIVAHGPHLVGLQEVSLWRTGPPGPPGTELAPATTVTQDFLRILLDALAARGAHYEAISISEAFDGQLPAAGPTGLFNVRLTDRDVILARTDLRTSQLKVLSTDEGLFDAALELPVLGTPLRVERGWNRADVKVRGKVIRFVNSHFEAFDPGEFVRQSQARELLDGPLDTQFPVVLVGDFNSAAPGGIAYGELLGGGFTDAWNVARPGEAGLTCCHAASLLDPVPTFTSRIDLILTRGAVDVLGAERIGADVDHRTPEGRWPSDHAGVVATLRVRVR